MLPQNPIYQPVSIQNKLHSFDEFTRLRTILIGRPHGANHPLIDATFDHFFQPPPDAELRHRAVGAVPREVVDEIEEDIQGFISVLRAHNVEVLRPAEYDSTTEFVTPFWRSTQLYSLMPRDCLLVVGDLLIEAPSPTRCRQFETFAFRPVLEALAANGAHILAAPRPMLADDESAGGSLNRLSEREILFDAANCVRFGKDLFIDVNRTANHRAVQWLTRTVTGLVDPSIRVHPMSLGNDHVDVTLIPLRPGVLLVDPVRVTEATIPPQLKHWKRVAVEEVMPLRDYGLPYPLASNDGIGRNVLVLGDNTVIVDDIQIPLIRALEKLRFNVIPMQYRHGRTLGGSWHCITLDTCRDGGLEDWISSTTTLQKSAPGSERFAEIFSDYQVDDACGINSSVIEAQSQILLAASQPSAELLSGLKTADLVRDPIVLAEHQDVILKALYAEYDAELFCRELDRKVADGTLQLSTQFRQFEQVWRRDEMDHTLGFVKLCSLLFATCEQTLLDSIRLRVASFDRLQAFTEDEFSICLLLAYDELVTTVSYTTDWKQFYPQFGCRDVTEWMKRLAADEARHYRNLISVLQSVHAEKLDKAAKILDAILDADLKRNQYAGTFVLDHDDEQVFPEETLVRCRERLERHLLTGTRD